MIKVSHNNFYYNRTTTDTAAGYDTVLFSAAVG